MKRITKACLVYQCGIANVFAVDCFNLSAYGRNARRIHQGSFRDCESFALGLATAGCKVGTFGCNEAGDIENSPWTYALDSLPWSDKFRPVWNKVR